MQHFGYCYNKQKKCYFGDKHKNQENVEYRRNFIEKYFKEERRTHRWIQIPEETAISMENDSELPLMQNIYFEYMQDNKKYVSITLMLTLCLKVSLQKCRCNATLLQSSSSSLDRRQLDLK